MIHIGYTGTRYGMTQDQGRRIAEFVDQYIREANHWVSAHHGCCIGGDADFHAICREHGWPNGPFCARVTCHLVNKPRPFLARNRDIIDAISRRDEDGVAAGVMLAAPLEASPQQRGGTWATVRMALEAFRDGRIKALHVVGADGSLFDHTGWKA